MNRLDAQLYRVNCIFLLGFDSQLLTHCAITGLRRLLFLVLFVVMRGREATVKCVASLQNACKWMWSAIKKWNKAFVSNHQQWNPKLSLAPRVCSVAKRSWIKWFASAFGDLAFFPPSFSPLSRGLDSYLINLQILFSIKCLQKDNCDFINSFLGSRWCSAGLPCWISDDAVVLCALYCGNP